MSAYFTLLTELTIKPQSPFWSIASTLMVLDQSRHQYKVGLSYIDQKLYLYYILMRDMKLITPLSLVLAGSTICWSPRCSCWCPTPPSCWPRSLASQALWPSSSAASHRSHSPSLFLPFKVSSPFPPLFKHRSCARPGSVVEPKTIFFDSGSDNS